MKTPDGKRPGHMFPHPDEPITCCERADTDMILDNLTAG